MMLHDVLTARIEELERRTGMLERRETSSAWRWDDLQGPATAGKTSATAPTFDYTNIGYLFPQNDTTRRLYYVFQLPHAWAEGTMIYPHVHYRQTTSATPVFRMLYAWYNIGGAVATPTRVYRMDTPVVPYSSGSIHQVLYASGGGIPGADKTISSILVCALHRNDSNTGGDVLYYELDIHYLRDAHGSRGEYTK